MRFDVGRASKALPSWIAITGQPGRNRYPDISDEVIAHLGDDGIIAAVSKWATAK